MSKHTVDVRLKIDVTGDLDYAKLKEEQARVFSDAERLQCAVDALNAQVNTNRQIEWYKKWMPVHFAKYGPQTTAQYSLTVLFLDHVKKLVCVETLESEK